MINDIKVHKVPQFMSKNVNVITYKGIPVCTVRGKKSTSDIVTKLSGYDIKIIDGRIDKIIEKLKEGAK